MSKNKDLVNLLRNIKYTSVSKIDMKYNKIFKEYNIENIIEHNNFANKVRKKWSNNNNNAKMKIITTNDKLKQIINTNKNAAKIQDLFFNTFNKEPIFKKINKKDNNKNKLNTKEISSKIKNIIENRKKFNISNTFLKRRKEENNRSPPICLYTPKYSYIYKHTPGFNFEKTISRKKDIQKNNELDLLNSDIINNSKDTNNNSSSINDINSKKRYIINSKSNKIIKTSLSPIHLSSKRSHISLLSDNNNERKKGNEENIFYKNQNNFFLSQQFSPINDEIENKLKVDYSYSPKLIGKNVLIPNFDKMLPRFIENNKKTNQLSKIDYSPNYNAIFCNVLNNNPIDYKKRKKYYKFKKIITIYNPTSEYLLFPELNLKE